MDALRSVMNAQRESSPPLSGVSKSSSAGESLPPPVAAPTITSPSDSTSNEEPVAADTKVEIANKDAKIPLKKKSKSADDEDKNNPKTPKKEASSDANAGNIAATKTVDAADTDGAAIVKKVSSRTLYRVLHMPWIVTRS